MKSISVVRKLDELGRVAIPIDVRRAFNLKENSPLEIYVEDDKICLKTYPAERHFSIEYHIEYDTDETLHDWVDDEDVYEELEKLLPRGAIIHTIFDNDQIKYIYEE